MTWVVKTCSSGSGSYMSVYLTPPHIGMGALLVIFSVSLPVAMGLMEIVSERMRL